MTERPFEREPMTAPGLPDLCAAWGPAGERVLLKRGVMGRWAMPAGLDVAGVNAALGVDGAQRAAMLFGSLFGWHVPGADPRNYDEDGRPLTAGKRRRRKTAPL